MRSKNLIFWVLCLYSFSTFAQTFRNPIITGMNPDPSIVRVGDDFYLTTSSFEYFPGLPIYHSKDLVNWKLIGYGLSKASNCPLRGCESSTGGNYAPTLRYHNGIFYLACTNYGGEGTQGQFYVTATNPAGPWSDPVWVGNWYVDPSMEFINDTLYYLTPNNADGFLLGIMNPQTGKYIKPLKKIATGTGGSSPEGPHLYKINNYYYLISAEGGTGYDHMEVVQRSASPWGPYEKSPKNPVLSNKNKPNHPFQAIGHADFVQLPDGSWWAVCLGIRPKGGQYHHLGRETFLAPITWDTEGWPKVGTDGVVQETYPLPNLPIHQWDSIPEIDDFDSDKLNLYWNFIRNPYTNSWSLTERPGYLRLKGSAFSFKEKDSPAFIGRRQTSFDVVASAKIDFIPVSSNEEAGLVVRYNDQNHYDLLITKLAGQRVVMLRKILKNKIVELRYREIPDDDIVLRISATDLEYKFWVQYNNFMPELLGTALTKDISTEKVGGGFTGVFIGMYASGNGKPNSNPADFDWFQFDENPTLPYSWLQGLSDSLNHLATPIISATYAKSYDQITLSWFSIKNAQGYLIEKVSNQSIDSIGFTTDTFYTDKGLEGKTIYLYRIKATNDLGYSKPSLIVSALTRPKPGPFKGIPFQIPGKIEAEDYDEGDPNIAYYDTDSINSPGAYRNDGVDVQSCWDSGNGYEIGWINNGEWVTYTVDVNDSLADINLRIASNSGGKIRFQINDTSIADYNISPTGGWSTYKTFTIPCVKLPVGKNKILKTIFLQGGFNINWIEFTNCKSASIQKKQLKEDFIFPNPANSYIQINTIMDDIRSIEIYSLSGYLIKTIRNFSERIDITDLNNGFYLLKITSGNEKIRYLKLTKI
ncbi:MAG: family 43 glycosylhydrolase [Bacteroidales bacterium]|nr:family 43 glycosylhydrolase [Bacteroidales bacterium]